MALVCYYRGACQECSQINVYGWTLNSKFMCCACHDCLDYSDTRHGPHEYLISQCIIESISNEEQTEIPEEIFDKYCA